MTEENKVTGKYSSDELIGKLDASLDEKDAMIRDLEIQCNYLRELASKAYAERNKVVAALANAAVKLRMPVLVSTHEAKENEIWDKEWSTVLYIKTPAGQISWHFHDSEAHLIASHVEAPVKFDGHTSAEKYDRLARAFK